MKVYLYTYAYDKIKQEGYKSLALFDRNSDHCYNILKTHRHSAKSDKFDDILAYLESTFEGRLRSICVITEIAPVESYRHPYLNYLVHHADVISFDLQKLINEGVVEAIYCKDIRQTALTDASFENIYKINNIKEIDFSPCDWHLCEKEEYNRLSPWATIKHYMLVLTKGYISPEYITLEVDNSEKRKTEGVI